MLYAERGGFEPPEGEPSTVFETAPFGRSGISPENIREKSLIFVKDFLHEEHYNADLTKSQGESLLMLLPASNRQQQ